MESDSWSPRCKFTKWPGRGEAFRSAKCSVTEERKQRGSVGEQLRVPPAGNEFLQKVLYLQLHFTIIQQVFFIHFTLTRSLFYSLFAALNAEKTITLNNNAAAAQRWAPTCGHETIYAVQPFHRWMNEVGNTPAILLHITISWNNSGRDVPTQLSGFIHNFPTRLKCIHNKQIHRQECGVTEQQKWSWTISQVCWVYGLKINKKYRSLADETILKPTHYLLINVKLQLFHLTALGGLKINKSEVDRTSKFIQISSDSVFLAHNQVIKWVQVVDSVQDFLFFSQFMIRWNCPQDFRECMNFVETCRAVFICWLFLGLTGSLMD